MSQLQSPEAMQQTGKAMIGVAEGATISAKNTVVGLWNIATNPKQALNNIWQAVSDPVKTWQGIKSSISQWGHNLMSSDPDVSGRAVGSGLEFAAEFLTPVKQLKNLKWSAELSEGTQVAGFSASSIKRLSRLKYAERVFSEAGKSGSDLENLVKTIDYSKAVKETILNPGDKVWRYERINSKIASEEMHFFTDAYGADAGATGVGFADPSGYKLVTYEVTEKTKVMESTIRGTKTQQYFSNTLQKSIKKVTE